MEIPANKYADKLLHRRRNFLYLCPIPQECCKWRKLILYLQGIGNSRFINIGKVLRFILE